MKSFEELVALAASIPTEKYSDLFTHCTQYIKNITAQILNTDVTFVISQNRGYSFGYFEKETKSIYLFKPNVLEYLILPPLVINDNKLMYTDDSIMDEMFKRAKLDYANIYKISSIFDINEPISMVKCRIVLIAHYLCGLYQGRFETLEVANRHFKYTIIPPTNFNGLTYGDSLKLKQTSKDYESESEEDDSEEED